MKEVFIGYDGMDSHGRPLKVSDLLSCDHVV